jgi:hypothetical protein
MLSAPGSPVPLFFQQNQLILDKLAPELWASKVHDLAVSIPRGFLGQPG